MAEPATRKAVVLAAGLGTRMRQPDARATLDAEQAVMAEAGLKAMIPVGRPFLDYVLSSLADAGLCEICLVVAPEHSAIRDHYEALHLGRVRLTYAVQRRPLGTADAVLASEEFVSGDDFLVVNSDNHYPVSALAALRELDGPGLAVFERASLLRRGNFPPDRLAKYAALTVSADGELERILEKPDEATMASLPEEALLSMNCWRFSPAIFEACRRVPRSARGEFELPGAVQHAISSLGMRFRAVRCREGVLDLSTRADIAPVAERLREVEVRL